MNNSKNLTQAYADLLIKVGLNLQAGQRLVIISQVEAADFVRQVAASAYRAGARFVNVIYRDDQVTLARYRFAPRDSFEEYPTWFSSTLEDYAKNGDALLRIYADDPDVLKGQDPELIATAQKAAGHHMRPFSQLQGRNALNWAVAGVPQTAWAQRVFPGETPGDAVERLWDAILRVCRMDQPDPIAAWQSHILDLMARRGNIE